MLNAEIPLRAVMVYLVEACAVVGVPEIVPVEVLMDKPVGSEGLTENVSGPKGSVPDTVGESGVIATVVASTTLCVGYVNVEMGFNMVKLRLALVLPIELVAVTV